jgi:hypothetical protein
MVSSGLLRRVALVRTQKTPFFINPARLLVLNYSSKAVLMEKYFYMYQCTIAALPEKACFHSKGKHWNSLCKI